MPNSFSKEERVAFDRIMEKFNDALVISKAVEVFQTNSRDMERAADTIWRPMPYIARSFDGEDTSANFVGQTQLSVPATISIHKNSPWTMTARQLRDDLQSDRFGQAAEQKIASDINVALLSVASLQGSIVVRRPAAASGFDDIAACDAAMNEIGVNMNDRRAFLSTRDYNAMAGNLAQRQNVVGKVLTAYDRAFVGDIAGFDTFKMDYALRLTAAVFGAGVTVNGANQRYVPRATSTAGTGEVQNVDNRFQNLTVTVGAGGALKVGDCFTIANVFSRHLITKQSTGQLKTFRINAIISGGGTAGTNVLQITPPIISADSAPTVAEQQYQNVENVPANGAIITPLNTVTGFLNPFFHKSAIELIPGRLAPDTAGADQMSATLDNGVGVVMTKQYAIGNMRTNYRIDTLFGVVNTNPEMSGVMLFSQT
jgi:hypothetical protein